MNNVNISDDEVLARQLAHDMTVAFDNHHSQPVTPDQIETRLEECMFAVKRIRAATAPQPCDCDALVKALNEWKDARSQEKIDWRKLADAEAGLVAAHRAQQEEK